MVIAANPKKIHTPLSGTTSRPNASPNFVVTVLSVLTGVSAEYASSDLVYADCSIPGKFVPSIAGSANLSSSSMTKILFTAADLSVSSGPGPDVLLNEDFTTLWASAGSQPHWIQLALPKRPLFGEFQIYLKDHGNYSPMDVGIYAGDPTLQLVKSIQLPFGNTGWFTLLTAKEVTTFMRKPPTVVKLEIKNNHQSGSNSKVTSVRVMGLKQSASHFHVGERVTIAPTYSVNGDDAWCLGSKAEPRTGVILGIPPSVSSTKRQESLLVARLDVPHDAFLFKPSWLVKVPNDDALMFRPGDRVQLDVSNWTEDDEDTLGKCLGKPVDRRYGIVRRVGPVRDGVQRNIEVVVGTTIESMSVSLYPSCKLVLAIRNLTFLPRDAELLTQATTALMARVSPNSPVNLTKLLEIFGPEVQSDVALFCFSPHKLVVQIWGRLVRVCGVEQVIQAYRGWCISLGGWGDEEFRQAIIESARDDSASTDDVIAIDESKGEEAPSSNTQAWQCEMCGFADNDPALTVCTVCGYKGRLPGTSTAVPDRMYLRKVVGLCLLYNKK
jgi:hypothetical protein